MWEHLFNMVVVNAYLLNRHYGLKKDLSQPEYHYILASVLLDYTPIPDVPADHGAMERQQGWGHWPELLPISTTAKIKKRKGQKCAHCFVSAKEAAQTGTQQKEANTSYICSLCCVPLCVYPCFGQYHMQRKHLLN